MRSQIRRFSLDFPTGRTETADAFAALQGMLGSEKMRHQTKDLFPQVEIRGSDREIVTLAVDGDERISFSGLYVPTTRTLMDLHELVNRMAGHVIRVDHVGINLPAEHASGHRLLDYVSQRAYLVRYPTGESWYFVLPVTEAEFRQGISDFSGVRFPKFEIVLEGADTDPYVMQIDCATNLTLEQLEEKLPDPFGVALPGLERFFRSVFVAHPWGGYLLRFDFRPHSPEEVNDWTSCEWLAKDGERIQRTSVTGR